jgi:hypothetical protein
MNHWRVWFRDHERPIEVETDECTHALAVGIALDVAELDARSTPQLLRVEHIDDDSGNVVETWPEPQQTRIMYRWNVWFRGRATPCKVVTDDKNPLKAAATAIDMLGLGTRERLNLLKVELIAGGVDQ